MAWTAAVSMTGSRLGAVMRRSNVVVVQPVAASESRRDTYTPGSSTRWSTEKLAMRSMDAPCYI